MSDADKIVRCAALDWNKAEKDYIPCSADNTIERVKIHGIITVSVELCAAHRNFFEEELRRFGGALGRKSCLEIISRKLRRGDKE